MGAFDTACRKITRVDETFPAVSVSVLFRTPAISEPIPFCSLINYENIDVLRSMRAILQQLELFVGLLEDYHMLIRELITLTRGSGFWRSKETPLLPGGEESV